MKRPAAPVIYTGVKIAGSNGAGLIDLTGGTITGPFTPDAGDLVVSIVEASGGFFVDAFKADDVNDFASFVGDDGTLQQYKTADLSGVTLIITLARAQ